MQILSFIGESGRDSLVNLGHVNEITRGTDGEGVFWIGFSVGGEVAVVWEYDTADRRDAIFAWIGGMCAVMG